MMDTIQKKECLISFINHLADRQQLQLAAYNEKGHDILQNIT